MSISSVPPTHAVRSAVHPVRAVATLALCQLPIIVLYAVMREMPNPGLGWGAPPVDPQAFLTTAIAMSGMAAIWWFGITETWERVAVAVLPPFAALVMYPVAVVLLGASGVMELLVYVASEMTWSDRAVVVAGVAGACGLRTVVASRRPSWRVPPAWMVALVVLPALLLPPLNALVYAAIVLLATTPGTVAPMRAPGGAVFIALVVAFALFMGSSVRTTAQVCDMRPTSYECRH